MTTTTITSTRSVSSGDGSPTFSDLEVSSSTPSYLLTAAALFLVCKFLKYNKAEPQ